MLYFVAGTGGVGIQAVPAATGATTGDVRFDKSLKGYGYMTITVSTSTVTTLFTQVNEGTGEKRVFESVQLDLGTMRVS